jgi:hypothetical protein
MCVEVVMVSLLFVCVAALAAPPQNLPLAIDVAPANALQEIPVPGEILEVETVVKGPLQPEDPNPTRLLLGPTGRSLKHGEVYVDDLLIFMPSVQVGITDRVSIGAGTNLLLPNFEPELWITPKVQVFARKKTKAAVGVLHITPIGNRGGGLAYGVVTRGTPDAAVTVGLGFPYVFGRGLPGGAPVFSVGGERRVSPRIKLVTENYVARGGGMAIGGVRVIRTREVIDVGLAAMFSAGYVFVFPTLRMAWRF